MTREMTWQEHIRRAEALEKAGYTEAAAAERKAGDKQRWPEGYWDDALEMMNARPKGYWADDGAGVVWFEEADE